MAGGSARTCASTIIGKALSGFCKCSCVPVWPRQVFQLASADPCHYCLLHLPKDLSTQGLKVTAVDESLAKVYASAINYDQHLPQYKTKGGFHQRGTIVTTPSLMLVEALDLLLRNMVKDSFPFDRVAAISGSGQQHGSVYWRRGAADQLHALQAGQGLAAQLGSAFSLPDAPIWRDSSTSAQCLALEEAVGGPQALADITGSRAYERFTASQIWKIAVQQPEVYAQTEQISLISSFMCSLFLGEYAPIDTSDGAGMNLLNLKTQVG